MSLRDHLDEAPGTVRFRHEVPTPAAYAVFDCETTGTSPEVDKIVSLAVVRLSGDGAEVCRYERLVRPDGPIPAEATAVHGIGDADVLGAPTFAETASELSVVLAEAVFVAHNAEFDLAMLQHAFAVAGIEYRPDGVACTLQAFRLLDPFASAHSLEVLCERHGVVLEDAHQALADVLATTALLRLLFATGIAPETVQLDREALWRLRSRGDTRPASDAQIRRVFALGYAVGLSRDGILELVARVAGMADVSALTREQVQDVYDALERSTAPSIGEAA